MTNSKNNPWGISDWVLAIVLIIIVIVLILSFGKVDLSTKKNKTQIKNPSLDDRIEAIRSQHAELEKILESQKKLKETLSRRFKRIYFLVRMLLILCWFGLNVCFSLIGLASTLEDFLNVNQAIVVGFIAIVFLFSGGFSNISVGIRYVKNIVENIVYRKYLNLEADIELTTAHSNQLKLELAKLEEESSFNSNFERLAENV